MLNIIYSRHMQKAYFIIHMFIVVTLTKQVKRRDSRSTRPLEAFFSAGLNTVIEQIFLLTLASKFIYSTSISYSVCEERAL